MKDLLLPHRIHGPSSILLQTLCVANRFLHLLVLSEKGRYEGIERDEEEVGLAMDKSRRSCTFMCRVWSLRLCV